MSGLIRPGRKNGHTLYAQLGDEPDDTDPFLGHCRAPEFAQLIRATLAGERAPRNPKVWCSGGLIYPGPGSSLTRDWIAAVDDPEVAWRIVAAVRGEAVDAKS